MGFSIIELLKYLFLGLVQGVTEVLPISSSGHVELFKSLANVNVDNNVMFLLLLNTGSLFAFIIIYFKKLIDLIKSFFIYIFKKEQRPENKQNFQYVLKIGLASIPAGIIGLLLEPVIENWTELYGLLLAGIGLLVTATVLFYVSSEHFHNQKTKISWLDSLYIGIGQAVAIFPGVSRSGMTTSTALKRKHGIDSALNFSFLMYIPISFAGIILLLFDLKDATSTTASVEYLYYSIAFVAAMIATYIAYKLIFNIFRSGKLRYFSYYCFGIGLLAIFLFVL
ncbi:MAG: undecaprenyl-diphosphate phosphatase [Candidatus Izemoplasmatales bacterium]